MIVVNFTESGKWRDTWFVWINQSPTRYGREISIWYKCFKNNTFLEMVKIDNKVTQINAVEIIFSR